MVLPAAGLFPCIAGSCPETRPRSHPPQRRSCLFPPTPPTPPPPAPGPRRLASRFHWGRMVGGGGGGGGGWGDHLRRALENGSVMMLVSFTLTPWSRLYQMKKPLLPCDILCRARLEGKGVNVFILRKIGQVFFKNVLCCGTFFFLESTNRPSFSSTITPREDLGVQARRCWRI